MSYGEFLNTIISPIQYFFDWATSLTTALISNYFFISMVGAVVITSLFYLLLDNLSFNVFNKKKKNLDNGGKK